MKVIYIYLYTYIVCFIIYLSYNTVSSFKPDSKSKGVELTHDIMNNDPRYRKECEVKERCRPCTFEELKNTNLDECKSTGYKLMKYCEAFDDKKHVGEFYITEPCSDNIKTNSVYILLLFCVCSAFLSLMVRKYHRKILLQSTLDKITIFKDK